jgi:thymidylate synthase ThyX
LNRKCILILLPTQTSGKTLMILLLTTHPFQITTKFLMTMTDTLTKLISVTPDAEKHMAYCARVSNPNNQENEKFSGLLKYCVKHQHWSIFEQAFMTLEINTTRGVAAQCLRHRSFTYQEFSQRYADSSLLAETIPLPELRRQDTKNRQNSIDDIGTSSIRSFIIDDRLLLFLT